jgi:hypothetical protein
MSSFSTRARLAARAFRTGDAGAESDGASGPGSREPTLPADLGVEAGTVGLFEDARITWCSNGSAVSRARRRHEAATAPGER